MSINIKERKKSTDLQLGYTHQRMETDGHFSSSQALTLGGERILLEGPLEQASVSGEWVFGHLIRKTPTVLGAVS